MSLDQPDRTTDLLGAGLAAASDGRCLLDRGTILSTRYRIEKELGRGGIGVVYLALDLRLHNAPVVVKLLLERFSNPEERAWFEKKFKDEIRALAQIDHPGVVRALDIGELADSRSYLVMQYVKGVALRSLIQPGGMELRRAAALIRQIGHALAAAHQRGVLHRDLKPENIMLQTIDSEEFVKLIDFGMATVLDSPGTVKTTMVAGTVNYMAPEQMQGRPSQLSDVFAMGVIAYEMVTGRLPFVPRSPYEMVELQRAGVKFEPRQLRPALSEAAQASILKALEFDPDKRPPNAAHFADALADALASDVRLEFSSRRLSSQSGIQLAHVLLVKVDGFSRMTVEEQSRRLEELQAAVRRTNEFHQAQAADDLVSQPATGGMVLIFFGADPIAAVRCALEIQRSLRDLGHLPVRVGIHTGPVKIISDINDRPNVSGDGVNSAERVISYAAPGQILLSRSVADVLRHLSEWSPRLRDLGERHDKGGERERVFSLVEGDYPVSDSGVAFPLAHLVARLSKVQLAAVAVMLVVSVVTVVLWRQRSSVAEMNSPPVSFIAAEPFRTLTYTVTAQKSPKRYPGSKPALATEGMFFEVGDRVWLNVNSNRDGHLYIINERPRNLALLFPNPAYNEGSAEVKANQPLQIPPRINGFEFDESEGTEKLWLVWSAQSVTELEAVKGKVKFGVINKSAEIESITKLLNAHSVINLNTGETTLSSSDDVVVALLKLEHRKTKR